MTPSWYDVLGVEVDATPAEIRTAWRASVADLDPTDRRFRQRNRAAEVLLDPERRAAHDRDLAAAEDDDPEYPDDLEPEDVETPEPGVESVERSEPEDAEPEVVEPEIVEPEDPEPEDPEDPEDPEPESGTVETAQPASRRGLTSAGLLRTTAVLAVVALVLVVVTIIAAVRVSGGDTAAADPGEPGSSSSDGTSGGALPTQTEIQTAVGAAETAVVPILSYNYRHLAQDEKKAQSFMTPAYSAEYGQYFAAAVLGNAPRTKTVVNVQVLASGVVRTGPGRVDVLLFVNRPTTNKNTSTTFNDQVTFRMLDTQGRWLVDCLITQPNGTCGH